jgi:hypothetical protein
MNDVPIMMIAYDNVRISNRPERWEMKRVLEIATRLGLIGLVSGFVYDRNPKLGVIVIGASWWLFFTPYSFQIIAYVFSGKIFRVNETYYLISSQSLYLGIVTIIGVASTIITSKILQPDFLIKKVLLQNTDKKTAKI